MDNSLKNISCKLTSPELQERKRIVLNTLKKKVSKREELPDGFSYQFSYSDELLEDLCTFVKTERLCCDFFDFKISINNDGLLSLDITGPDGVKKFIADELEM